MKKLAGRLAIVTGGGRGLGRSIALALAREGADLAIVYPPFDAKPDAVAAEIRALGCRAEPYQADVSDEAAVQRMVAAVLHDFGRIDILVNNAGKMIEKLLIATSVQEWDETLATDLRSVFLCCRSVLAGMMERKRGAIVNVASQIAYKGGLRLSHYAAAKAGVVALTKSLALEVAGYGIRVNAIAPGPILTDMLRDYMHDPEWIAAKERSIAIGRFLTAEEIAPSVVFLVSDDAAPFTGQTLLPNGGGVMI